MENNYSELFKVIKNFSIYIANISDFNTKGQIFFYRH